MGVRVNARTDRTAGVYAARSSSAQNVVSGTGGILMPMSIVLALATEAPTVPSAPVFLLDRLANLKIGDIWATDHPDEVMTLLGTTVHWSRHTISYKGDAVDFVLEDSDGGWHAFRLFLRHPKMLGIDWTNDRGRLYLLTEALDPATSVTSAMSLGALIHALGTDPEPLPERLVASGDRWETGTLLLGALTLLDETDRTGHETLLALRNPLLVPMLHQLENWCDNHRLLDYYDQLGEAWDEALGVLWPNIPGTEPESALEPSHDGFETLMLAPRKDWSREALAYLYAKSQDEGPDLRLFWELRRKWAVAQGVPELPVVEFAALLPSLTVVPDFLATD